MRRYTIIINDTPHVIDVEERSADTFDVRYDGRLIDVRLEDHQDIAHASITPEMEVLTSASPPHPIPETPSVPRTLSAPPRPAGASAAPTSTSGAGSGVHAAPMPGVVLSVAVKPGNKVSRGDALLVLEAMKMKNTLFAERDGVVADVLVNEGQQVKFGEALVRYEDR